ncbi:hypothetical protein [Salicibibacter kimchii]|uniref:Uncharacterized protein n=1 Tax=Salicibibacter kimchii TaxID=2099786 RepID=A0A345C1S1_9BACI|nr:hypothetical protein [Salicibibacter kimchii]AXF57152.1 hypothetical protein DT065_14870 [Salicibibacter kimchii]
MEKITTLVRNFYVQLLHFFDIVSSTDKRYGVGDARSAGADLAMDVVVESSNILICLTTSEQNKERHRGDFETATVELWKNSGKEPNE